MTIDKGTVEDLLEEFGSPLFLVSEKSLSARYAQLSEALAEHYENSTIAYSFKTNYLPKICKAFKEKGAFAEVVSGFEYTFAHKLGYKDDEIIFNGPHKPDDAVGSALRDGCTVNADSMEDLARMYEVARGLGRVCEIGMRVSTSEIRFFKQWRRFGFNIENGAAERACRFVKEHYGDFLTVRGFHIHIGTGVRDPAGYAQAASTVARFVTGPAARLGIHPEYLDFGGGFVTEHHGIRGIETKPVPPIGKFVAAIADILQADMADCPRLILEPGRFLVADSTMLATRVLSAERLPDGRQHLTVDATIGMLPDAPYMRHAVHSFASNPERVLTFIYGASCTVMDSLHVGELPVLRRGDVLLLMSCGAYSISRSAQFIYPRPAVVWITADDTHSLARKSETPEDLTRLDSFE